MVEKNDFKIDEYPGNITEIGDVSGFGMTINCVIGTGFFAIPCCYYIAGLPLAIIMTLICGLMSGIGAIWSIEVQARARNYDMCNKDRDLLDASNNKLTFRKIEYSEFGYIFSGRKGRIFISGVLLLYTQGSLWSYVSVFSSTSANLFSKYILRRKEDCIMELASTKECHTVFYLCVVGYAIYVFIVVLFELDKLRYLQNFFTIYRFFSFSLMVVSAIISLACNGSQWPADNKTGWYAFKFRGFPMLFASVSVGLNGHFNLPNALCVLLRRPKAHAHAIAFFATLTAATLYIACSSVMAFALGPDTHAFVVLNWSRFGTRGFAPEGTELVQSWWSITLKMIIMLFPMMNMMSSYPLVVGTVGGSLYSFLTDEVKQKFGRPLLIACRYAAATLPFLLGALMPNLQSITDFAGLFAIFLEVFIPAYYLQRSKRIFGDAARTPYTGWWSHTGLVVFVFTVAVLFFTYGVVQFIMDYAIGGGE